MIHAITAGVEIAFIAYFVMVNGWYALLLVASYREVIGQFAVSRSEGRWRLLSSELAPTVSLLVPAHNEESTVVSSVQSMLALQYPRLEVVVVNDGSRDRTVAVLKEHFELIEVHPFVPSRLESATVKSVMRSRSHPNLVVVDKENGGKSDALNAAMNFASGELVCAVDADTLIEPDALIRMARPFVWRDDVVAAGGTLRVANECVVESGRVTSARVPRSYLAGIQSVEYLRAFLFGRLGWNRLGGNLVVSGAFGLFDRHALVEAGGYRTDTVGEDIDLVARLRKNAALHGGKRRVQFIPDPVAWTEVPSSIRVLGRQRDRWHRGLAEVLWSNRRLMFRPRYGTLGMVVLPYFLLVEMCAPVLELIGLVITVSAAATGTVDWAFAGLFFLVAYGLGATLTVGVVLLDELSFPRYDRATDVVLLIAWALIESFGYHQMTVVWRLRGLVRFARKSGGWGEMTRVGFSSVATSVAGAPNAALSDESGPGAQSSGARANG